MNDLTGKVTVFFSLTVLSMLTLNFTCQAVGRGVTDKAYKELREWCESGEMELARSAKARLTGFLA